MTAHVRCSARKFAGCITGLALAMLLLPATARRLAAQPPPAAPSFSVEQEDIMSGRSLEARPLPPLPGDVLTPDERTNTPNIKIGVRAGINRSSYTNDRYLNNVLLDVGEVSGETDIYASAAGFGYMAGVDVEYPLNDGLSLLATAEYDHVTFGSSGAVQEPCVDGNGHRNVGSSIHEFRATFDFIKLAGSVKASFSSWYLTAGIAVDHPFSTTLDRTRRLGGSDCYFPDTDHLRVIEEHGEVPSPQRLHYSLRLGWGLIYELADGLQFSPELTLDFGLGSINKSPNSDLGVYGISATLRYDIR